MSWLGAATRHVEINRRLSSCKNFQELQQVIDSADGSLSLVNMVTAMHRLAKVATGHKRESRALSQQLQKKLSQRLKDRGSRLQFERGPILHGRWRSSDCMMWSFFRWPVRP